MLPKLFWGILFLAALVGFFIFVYLMNRKIPVPPGCEDLLPDCQSCSIHSCAKHPTQMEEK